MVDREARVRALEERVLKTSKARMVELVAKSAHERSGQMVATDSAVLVSPPIIPSVVPPSMAGIGVGSGTLGTMIVLDGAISGSERRAVEAVGVIRGG
mmetsp:Transcript_34137/g.46161  ORF Transcript_34137/g.46161 Transcript_34137/m.46161 type:complete len:98 (+) Transcript_34137:636-929(+)